MRDYNKELFGFTEKELDECVKLNISEKISNSPLRNNNENFFDLLIEGSELLNSENENELKKYLAAQV